MNSKGTRAHKRIGSRLLAAATLLLATGLAACGGKDETAFSTKTLIFTERPSDNFGFFDNPPKTRLSSEGPEKLSNGDQLTFSSAFVDRSKRDVGELDVSCSVTRAGGFNRSREQCTGTATLPGGALTLARGGRVFANEASDGAVLGGTERYAGATGHFTENEGRNGQTTYTFHLSIPD